MARRRHPMRSERTTTLHGEDDASAGCATQRQKEDAQLTPVGEPAAAPQLMTALALSLTEHVISWGYVVIGEKQFLSMPKEYQDIFMEAAQEMQEYEHELFLEKEKLLRKELESDGMEFVDVELKEFQSIGSEAVYNSLNDTMKELYTKIKAL